MKRIFSFLLAILLLVSAIPTALATNDYSQGTQVVYQATGSESYTITVPAQLAPGGNGTVTLSGTWADNRIVTVTADPTVTLTNSIKAEDQKVLNVHFDGISEAGSNTTSQTFTQGISVDGITDALFGTWSGKFNYNVVMSNVAGGDSGTTEPSDPDTGDDVITDLNPDDGTTPADGDVYTAGDYKYTYYNAKSGWSVTINTEVTDKKQTSYGAILESINGEPVTNMAYTFYSCTSLTTAPEIPASVTNMEGTFDGCTGLTAAPEIPASVTNMNGTFYDCRGLTGEIELPCSLASQNYTYSNCPATITYYHVDGCDGSCGK